MRLSTGERLKRARLLQGLTIRELEDKTGVTRSTISRLEKDEFKRVPKDIVQKLAPILGISPESLYVDETLSHYPDYLLDFIFNKKALRYVELAYLSFRQDELNGKI